MDRYEKIRREIEQIERELKELRAAAGTKRIEGSLRELSLKNDRIKSAFSTIRTTINAS